MGHDDVGDDGCKSCSASRTENIVARVKFHTLVIVCLKPLNVYRLDIHFDPFLLGLAPMSKICKNVIPVVLISRLRVARHPACNSHAGARPRMSSSRVQTDGVDSPVHFMNRAFNLVSMLAVGS